MLNEFSDLELKFEYKPGEIVFSHGGRALAFIWEVQTPLGPLATQYRIKLAHGAGRFGVIQVTNIFDTRQKCLEWLDEVYAE